MGLMMSDWAPSDSSPLEGLEALLGAECSKPRGWRPCQPYHARVFFRKGRLLCQDCFMTRLAGELGCECLTDGRLVFWRDGMYHAKPGPCVGRRIE